MKTGLSESELHNSKISQSVGFGAVEKAKSLISFHDAVNLPFDVLQPFFPILRHKEMRETKVEFTSCQAQKISHESKIAKAQQASMKT